MEAKWKEKKCAKEREMEEDEKLKAVCGGKDTKEDKESKKWLKKLWNKLKGPKARCQIPLSSGWAAAADTSCPESDSYRISLDFKTSLNISTSTHL